MAMLTPAQKRDHFRDRRKAPEVPPRAMALRETSTRDIEIGCNRLRDELLTALRLDRAQLAARASVWRYEAEFPETARSMMKAANQHRRLWWYAAYAAARELGLMLAAVNGDEKLSHDEAGADLDQDARRLLEWLVDVGREANNRRSAR